MAAPRDRFDREEQDSHFYEFVDGKKKPCRACSSFKSVLTKYTQENKKLLQESEPEYDHKQCPLDKDELGRRTWSFLHTMAAYYPDKPTPQQQEDMKDLITKFSKFYPCDWCAKDFRKSIKKNEPDTKSQSAFSLWMCQQHNEVNRKLGKPEFDCKLYNERWRDGWKDGSCD